MPPNPPQSPPVLVSSLTALPPGKRAHLLPCTDRPRGKFSIIRHRTPRTHRNSALPPLDRHFPDDLARPRCRAAQVYRTAPWPQGYTFFGHSCGLPGLRGVGPGRPQGRSTPPQARKGPVWPAERVGSARLRRGRAALSDRRAHPEGATPTSAHRSRRMRSRMAANSFRGTATSAIWKIT